MAHLDMLFIRENMPPSQSVFILEELLIFVFLRTKQKFRPSFKKKVLWKETSHSVFKIYLSEKFHKKLFMCGITLNCMKKI